MRLNPRDPSIFFRYSSLSFAHFVKEDYVTACEWAQRAVLRKSDWWFGQALLAASVAFLDRPSEARACTHKSATSA